MTLALPFRLMPGLKGRKRATFPRPVPALAAVMMAIATPAAAQSGAPVDSVGQDAVDAAAQPLSDLGLRSRDIPLILLAAQDAPYAMTGLEDCAAIRREIAVLEDTLGADADVEDPDNGGLINQGLRAGGNVLSGFIPFRGLVRQVSGARAEEKRWEAAVYAGVARRSFLKGFAAGQSCPTAQEDAITSAHDLLGLTPKPEVEVVPNVPRPYADEGARDENGGSGDENAGEEGR